MIIIITSKVGSEVKLWSLSGFPKLVSLINWLFVGYVGLPWMDLALSICWEMNPANSPWWGLFLGLFAAHNAWSCPLLLPDVLDTWAEKFPEGKVIEWPFLPVGTIPANLQPALPSLYRYLPTEGGWTINLINYKEFLILSVISLCRLLLWT